jgi:hypothetical protein
MTNGIGPESARNLPGKKIPGRLYRKEQEKVSPEAVESRVSE